MLAHLPLFNFRIFIASAADAAAALTTKADWFALLSAFLGNETVERGAGSLALKFPFIILLSWNRQR
jgi:hypothetical protein